MWKLVLCRTIPFLGICFFVSSFRYWFFAVHHSYCIYFVFCKKSAGKFALCKRVEARGGGGGGGGLKICLPHFLPQYSHTAEHSSRRFPRSHFGFLTVWLGWSYRVRRSFLIPKRNKINENENHFDWQQKRGLFSCFASKRNNKYLK
jgi:hypothetical protein